MPRSYAKFGNDGLGELDLLSLGVADVEYLTGEQKLAVGLLQLMCKDLAYPTKEAPLDQTIQDVLVWLEDVTVLGPTFMEEFLGLERGVLKAEIRRRLERVRE